MNEVTTSNTPDKKEPATGFAVITYIHGVTEPIKKFWKATTFMLLKDLFRPKGIFLPNLRILSQMNN